MSNPYLAPENLAPAAKAMADAVDEAVFALNAVLDAADVPTEKRRLHISLARWRAGLS